MKSIQVCPHCDKETQLVTRTVFEKGDKVSLERDGTVPEGIFTIVKKLIDHCEYSVYEITDGENTTFAYAHQLTFKP